MRALWLVVLSFLLSVVAAAADERPCDPGIGFAPSGGSLGTSSAVTWRAEPANTASRVVMVIGADGKSDAEQAKPGRHNLKLKRGTSTVVLVFYDAKGQVICTATTMVRGAGSAGGSGAGIAAGTDSLSSPGSASGEVAAAAPTVVVMGRYVVVFLGDTAYAGAPDKVNEWVAGNTYDGRTANLTGYIGLEIYGNNQPNTIWGSDLDDVINGGDESCAGILCVDVAGGRLGDTIYGMGGNDVIRGGDERCQEDSCNAYGVTGDVIDGGDGDDEIHGGAESCAGTYCTSAGQQVGDTIVGGKGRDTIFGGNETCGGGSYCSFFSHIGDVIDGGDDADKISGGDESCTGFICTDYGAHIGDDIQGGAGDDEINGGDESCTDAIYCQSALIGDAIDGGPGADVIVGGTETCDTNCTATVGDDIEPDTADSVTP